MKQRSSQLTWYLTTLAFRGMWSSKHLYLRQCHCLIQADEDMAAYQNAKLLGIELLGRWSKSESSLRKFVGVEDLVLVSDEPSDGSEILWVEYEMTDTALEKELSRRPDFLKSQKSTSGWFIAKVLLYEVVLNARNDRHLVWENWYLIEASDFDTAYQKATDIGEAHGGKAGEHTTNSKPAVWKFGLVQRLQPAVSAPGDQSVLWYDDVPASKATFSNLSSINREDTSLFEWRSSHRTSPLSGDVQSSAKKRDRMTHVGTARAQVEKELAKLGDPSALSGAVRGKPETSLSKGGFGKRTPSFAARKRIEAAQRARWAKVRAKKRS
jgi:hypothetical protein